VLGLLALASSVVHAKAPPLARVAIVGPHLIQPIVITDRPTLDALAPGMLEDVTQEVLHPPVLAPGYTLVRSIQGPDGQLYVLDRLHYQPHPRAGWCGYLRSLGPEGIDQVADANSWFFATPSSEAVVRQVLRRYSVPFPSAEQGAVPRCQIREPAPLQWAVLMVMGLILPLLVAFLATPPSSKVRHRLSRQCHGTGV